MRCDECRFEDRTKTFGESPSSARRPLRINGGLVNEYRMHRIADAKESWGKPPARTTTHQEIVCLQQILKTALRQQWLKALLIFQSLIGRTGRSPIAPGSHARSTASSTRRPGGGPGNPRTTNKSNGASSCMTSSYS